MTRSIPLLVIPGAKGAKMVQVTDTTTWQNVVDSEGLAGRNLYGNGLTIDPANYNQAVPMDIAEMCSTQGTKGN